MTPLFLVAEGVAGACYGVPAARIPRPLDGASKGLKAQLISARQLAIFICADSLGLLHDDIAGRYSMHRTMVSKVLSKFAKLREKRPDLDDALDRLGEGLTAFNHVHPSLKGLIERAANGKKANQED